MSDPTMVESISKSRNSPLLVDKKGITQRLLEGESAFVVSKSTGVGTKTLSVWLFNARDEARKSEKNYISLKEGAIEQVIDFGNSQKDVAISLNVPLALLSFWVAKRKEKRYAPELKISSVQRVIAGERVVDVARELGLNASRLGKWALAEQRATGEKAGPKAKPKARTRYGEAVRQEVITRVLNGDVMRVVAHEMKVSYQTVRHWVSEAHPASDDKKNKPTRKHSTQYTSEDKARHVEMVAALGVAEVARRTGVTSSTLYRWAEAAGLNLESHGDASQDAQFTWVQRECPHLEDWRQLALGWIQENIKGLRGRIRAVRLFMREYLVGQIETIGMATTPEFVLSRANKVPDFFASCLSKLSYQYSTSINNYVHDFLNWVLLTTCSLPDDHDRPVILSTFHNIVPYRVKKGSRATDYESVRSPLPYGYIDELRSTLAQGPNFSDWTWAHNVLGNADVVGGKAGPEWFEVDEKLIDKNDPDCVWRRRVLTGRVVLEMWSPVRWVTLLIKLQLPLRTTQVRLLDSGEADTWLYTRQSGNVEWVKNKSRIVQGTERKPHRQGVFRKPTHASLLAEKEMPRAILYINTNKSADSNASASEKGYEMPWLLDGPYHSNPFYWFEKLRNWQKKYNPVSRLTSWKELTDRHINLKSDVQLSNYFDSCFLFRAAEDRVIGEAHLPLSHQTLDRAWYELLKVFQERLASRGERHEDGSKIELVYADSVTRTYFPRHSLRVSLITAFALEGQVPFPILQKLVGHSRLLMTLYYTKIGHAYSMYVLSEAAKKLESEKAKTIIEFLKNTEHDKLVAQAISNSSTSIAASIPVHIAHRNPAGWMPMHHGLCIVGGNTHPIDNNKQVGGCYNGGQNIGNDSNPRYAPVPGGARNCVRCRWFVTQPHYIVALVAHMNNVFYHYDETRIASVEADKKLIELKRERAKAEELHQDFLKPSELKQAERVVETALQRFSDLAEDAAACIRLIHRCEEAAKLGAAGNAIVAVGAPQDWKSAVEECDSELLQLSGVCEDAEVYPDLSPGKAVFRRSQLLDAALMLEGTRPIFLTLSEEEQLKVGNTFMMRAASAFDPDNPMLGRRKVISLIEAKQSLSKHLGVNVSTLLNSDEWNQFKENGHLEQKRLVNA